MRLKLLSQLVYFLTLLLSSGVGLYLFKKIPIPLRVLIVLLVLTLANEFFVHFVGSRDQNILAYWGYAILSCCIVPLTIGLSSKLKIMRNISLLFTVIITAFGILSLLSYETLPFPSKWLLTIIPALITYIVITLFKRVKEPSVTPLFKNWRITVPLIFLAYYTLTLLYLGSINYFINKGAVNEILNGFNRIVSIVYYLSLGYILYSSAEPSRIND